MGTPEDERIKSAPVLMFKLGIYPNLTTCHRTIGREMTRRPALLPWWIRQLEQRERYIGGHE
jgi:hypothetical protein